MWFGLSRFEKAIPKANNQMRGLRLRKENIQIGSDDNEYIQDLFKEKRGNSYFVGEIFAADQNLIPNSQRYYFNENETRVYFEDRLRIYFYDTLHKLYYDANRLKNSYKKQVDYIEKVSEFEKKIKSNGFIGEEHKQKLQYEIEKAKKDAEQARKHLIKMEDLDDNLPIVEVHNNIKKKYKGENLKKEVAIIEPPSGAVNGGKRKPPYLPTTLSKLSKTERKLVGKIYSIISEIAPKELSEKIIHRIQEELK